MAKILIVDDIESWRRLCAETFEMAGYFCDYAITVEDANEKLDISSYNLVCMNLKIVEYRNGRALLQRLDNGFSHIPVIIVTGFFGGPTSSIETKLANLKERHKNVKEILLKGDPESVGEEFIDALLQAAKDSIKEKKRAVDDYVDFHLHIGPNGHARAHSEQGERTATISLKIPTDVDLMATRVEQGQVTEQLLATFGRRLYEILCPAQIDIHLNVTEASTRTGGRKVRIRLTIEPDILAQLPWEFMFRSEGSYFLATNPGTVLSHYLDLPLPPNYVRGREGPLHMLTIISNPSDQSQLDVDRWEAMVHEALSAPISQGTLALETVKLATFEKIRDALLAQPPDIVQFIGHGVYHNGQGYLALVDSNTGRTWKVDDVRFASIFAGVQDHLGLVSLATCESAKSDSPKSFLGIAPRLVQRGTPAVIAMRYPVLVSTAEIFLENFYKALAARYPVDWAVQSARNAVAIKIGMHNREFATPVLFMRAKDGNIF